MSGGAPLPQLGISSGPSMSDGTNTAGADGFASTGDFILGGQKAGLLERSLPLILVGVALWFVSRRR